MSRLLSKGPATSKPCPGPVRLPPTAVALATAALLCSAAVQGWGADGAARVNRLLTRLKQPKNGPASEVFTLSEADLNDFARAVLAGRKRLGVQTVQIDLQKNGRIDGTAVVNMDKVRLEGFAVSMFRAALSGTQVLRTRGKFSVLEGRGLYSIEQASFNGVTVPAWLVESVVGYLGARQPPHLDVTEPFDLPFGIVDVRIEPDKLVLVR